MTPERCPCCTMTRRSLLLGAATLPLAACGDSFPIRLVSDEQVTKMGLQSWQQLRAKIPASRNTDYQKILQEVGTRLLGEANENPRAWQMVVFASPEPNAFVLPGRRMGVFEGMFRVAANAHQLAAVVGHEIGHLKEEHPHERASASMLRLWGLNILSFVLAASGVQYANEIASVVGLGTEFGLLRPFSRSQELEADKVGVILMAKAGFRPAEAIELWRRMAQAGTRQPDFLSTHPAPEQRIRALEQLIRV